MKLSSIGVIKTGHWRMSSVIFSVALFEKSALLLLNTPVVIRRYSSCHVIPPLETVDFWGMRPWGVFLGTVGLIASFELTKALYGTQRSGLPRIRLTVTRTGGSNGPAPTTVGLMAVERCRRGVVNFPSIHSPRGTFCDLS